MTSFVKRQIFACVLPLAAAVGLAGPAFAIEMTPGQSALYESVSIYPPTGNFMTVCYGFVCRRRMEFEFTVADKKALDAVMAKGKASAAAERAADTGRGSLVGQADRTDSRHEHPRYHAPISATERMRRITTAGTPRATLPGYCC